MKYCERILSKRMYFENHQYSKLEYFFPVLFNIAKYEKFILISNYSVAASLHLCAGISVKVTESF
jgi:hypothetical protein